MITWNICLSKSWKSMVWQLAYMHSLHWMITHPLQRLQKLSIIKSIKAPLLLHCACIRARWFWNSNVFEYFSSMFTIIHELHRLLYVAQLVLCLLKTETNEGRCVSENPKLTLISGGIYKNSALSPKERWPKLFSSKKYLAWGNPTTSASKSEDLNGPKAYMANTSLDSFRWFHDGTLSL